MSQQNRDPFRVFSTEYLQHQLKRYGRINSEQAIVEGDLIVAELKRRAQLSTPAEHMTGAVLTAPVCRTDCADEAAAMAETFVVRSGLARITANLQLLPLRALLPYVHALKEALRAAEARKDLYAG